MTASRPAPPAVLLVTDLFPPDIGGPATFVPALAHALAARGHAVTVVCRSDDPRAPEPAAWPFRVVRTPRAGGPGRRLRVLAALLREVGRSGAVFTNGLERATALACRARRRPYTLKVVGDLAWERARGEGLTDLGLDEFQAAPAAGAPWRRWAARRAAVARGARLVITPSDYLRRIVLGWGVPPARAVTVPNGVPPAADPPAPPARRAPGAPLRALWLGRMVRHKGLEGLLPALAGLARVHLDLVGDGPLAPRLRALVERHGLAGAVAFHGARPHAEALARLAAADVLLLPSQYEGLPHTLLEACAAGVPAVASDRGGNPEVIEPERSGLLVPYARPDLWREAICRLRDDEDLRARLARGARARSRAFDLDRSLAATAALLLGAPAAAR